MPLMAALLFCACVRVGILDRDTMPSDLPQDHFIPHPASRVWSAVLAVVGGLGGTILVEDRDAFLASAIVEIDPDDERHATLVPNSLGGRGGVRAITQVRLREVPGGCQVSLREIYFPARSVGGISHSRGDYERLLLQEIQRSLTGSSRGTR